jgi:hypothetical protein
MSAHAVQTLEQRVWQAIATACGEVRRARILVEGAQVVREPSAMLTRCAWCGRYALGDGWADPDETPVWPERLGGRTTHGICGQCLRMLETSGASRPLVIE